MVFLKKKTCTNYLMDIERFIQQLKHELGKPLPGKEAQLQMSSMRRIRELMDVSATNNAVLSSVLILLFPSDNKQELQIVFIQRPDYDGIHGGQISLPGGKHEDSDDSMVITALRESKEEIGIIPADVTIIGQLSDLYIPPSNYLVMPFVGYTLNRPDFKPDPQEVAAIVQVNIDDLKNDHFLKWKNILIRSGISIYAPCFEIEGHTIWGATAMIVNEFKAILRKIPS